MIHYHGGPPTPQTVAVRAWTNGHAFISYREPRGISLAADIAASFAVDNGAYSAWRSGTPIKDWSGYYAWVSEVRLLPGCDFAVIPDVIDGSEGDNDALVAEWPHHQWGAPVWHLHESLARLERLAADWMRVCLGSSGLYAQTKTTAWWMRMKEAMHVLCDTQGRPLCRIHGLRMLDGEIVKRFPFASADSTNIARNTSINQHWRGTYPPPTIEARATVLRERIESYQSPPVFYAIDDPIQGHLFVDGVSA